MATYTCVLQITFMNEVLIKEKAVNHNPLTSNGEGAIEMYMHTQFPPYLYSHHKLVRLVKAEVDLAFTPLSVDQSWEPPNQFICTALHSIKPNSVSFDVN